MKFKNVTALLLACFIASSSTIATHANELPQSLDTDNTVVSSVQSVVEVATRYVDTESKVPTVFLASTTEDQQLNEIFGELQRKELIKQENSVAITSTNDEIRYKALEEKFDIQLEPSDHWSTVYPNYTAHETLKQLGYYHVNANRQALIKYAIRTDDWQPYRAFEAERSPLYFEIVDGKFEYSKIYYGNLLESIMYNYKAVKYGTDVYSYMYDDERKKELESIYEREIEEMLEKFRDAPGIVPYVVHINHTEELAKEFNVPQVAEDYFDSPYNHPDVLEKGKFAEKEPIQTTITQTTN